MAPLAQVPLPSMQTQLLLHQPRSPYETFSKGGVPELRPGELLVQIEAIGLNPIDWKSAYDKPPSLATSLPRASEVNA